jgi:hypothetical protein
VGNVAEQHDLWLRGIGIDVRSFLTPPPVAVAGSGFKTTSAEGEAEALAGAAEIGKDGTVSGKGAVLKAKRGDDESEVLSGEFQSGPDGTTAKGTLLKSKSQDGALTDTVGEVELSRQKAAVTGVKREVDFGKASGGLLPDNIVAKGDAAAGTASVDASVSDETISFGAQANVGEGSLTLGTSGTKRDDGSDSDLDQTFRFGVSEGGGLAGRIHFGDADKDGNPEIGVGADVGFVSFDVKTEDPLRTGLAFANAASGPTSLIPATFGVGGTLDDENLTKKVVDPQQGVNAGRDLGSAAQAGITETVNDAKEGLLGGVTGLLGGADD